MSKVSQNRNINYDKALESFSSHLVTKLFNKVTEGILITNASKKILTVNSAFEVVTGYKFDEVIGLSPAILQSGLHDASFYKNMWATIDEYGEWEGEIWNKRKNGELYPEGITIFNFKNTSGEITNYLAIFTDLSERKTIENELKKTAVLDLLTDVNNRFSYLEKMKVLLDASKNQRNHAIFYLNLDRFKQINDTLGHATGDLLLVEVANRIKGFLKGTDILARYGGDEFAFTLTNIKDPREAAEFAQNLLLEIEKPIILNNQEVFVSSSVGISLYPEDGTSVEQLISSADKAMTYSKGIGHSSFSFYFDDLNIDVKRLLLLDTELRKAIENQDFELYYQPKLELNTQEIIGVEALVRWNNSKLGFVSPTEFIEYAEDTGLIIPLSEIIVEEACLGYAELVRAGYGNLSIAINISSLHFQQQNFLESLNKILERNNTSAQNLEIEVTERTVMNNASETVSKLVRLKQMGFKLSIDDFGTGYSSLSYLVRFPLDILKIDRSFIQQICSLDEKQAVVDAIIQMSHRLKMKVVAEGVETEQQAALLREMGCDIVQGYYYSKPIPMHELLELLPYWEVEHQGRN